MQPDQRDLSGPIEAGVRLFKSSVSVSDSVALTALFDNYIIGDTFGRTMWTTGQSKVFAPVRGIYAALWQVNWTANGTGQRFVRITRNGTEIAGVSVAGHATFTQRQQAAHPAVYMQAGQYLEAIFETVGVTLNASGVFHMYLVRRIE